MTSLLRVLIVEDNPADVELVIHELRRAGFEPELTWVDNRADFENRLGEALDLIIADYSLPQLDALHALEVLKATGLDIPFILVNGVVGEETVADLMRIGAADYVLKDRPARFGSAVRHALEQKRLRDTNRQALEQQKELNSLKSRFASMVSHEFRAPLTVIRTSSDLLAEHEQRMSAERKREHLEQIQRQVTHLTTLLDEILIISRAETVGTTFQPVPSDLQALISERIDEIRSTATTHQIRWFVEGPARAVLIDVNLMKRAVNNLLSNAVKYSQPGSEIVLELAYGSEQITIQVRDQGIGIPAEDQEKLFQPFYRATNVGTAAGTGLGLAIVKQAVDAHGGSIRVESTVGQGTTFIVTFPLRLPPGAGV